MNELKDRQQSIEIMKTAYKKGFRYVVRDKDSEWLTFFSLKPKRYRKMEFWGYEDENASGVLPADVVKNQDIHEINWNNKSATMIEEFIKKEHMNE